MSKMSKNGDNITENRYINAKLVQAYTYVKFGKVTLKRLLLTRAYDTICSLLGYYGTFHFVNSYYNKMLLVRKLQNSEDIIEIEKLTDLIWDGEHQSCVYNNIMPLMTKDKDKKDLLNKAIETMHNTLVEKGLDTNDAFIKQPSLPSI